VVQICRCVRNNNGAQEEEACHADWLATSVDAKARMHSHEQVCDHERHGKQGGWATGSAEWSEDQRRWNGSEQE
jgi:hypothetical protein